MKSALSALLLLGATVAAQAQRPWRPDTAALQRLLIAEDARGTGADGLAPLLTGIHSSDTMLRRVAVRGLGRLQRPDLGHQLGELLTDPVPAIRAEAANAIAQSMVRVKRIPTDPGQADVSWAATTLATALDVEPDPAAGEALAESLGRLPYAESPSAGLAESAILRHAAKRAGFGSVHALYWLAQDRLTTGGLAPNAVILLKGVAFGQGDAATRRVAALTLGNLRLLDSALVATLLKDPDEQLRRLALAGVTSISNSYRATVVQSAFADPSPIVRVAAVVAARAGNRQPDCTPIIAATNDKHPYVVQMAIDALGSPCADSLAAVKVLDAVLDESKLNHRSWPERNHALIALAKLGHIGPLRRLAPSTAPEAQIGFAEAAAAAGDTAILLRLAGHRDHNVHEAAIAGLAKAMKHRADSVYIAALTSTGYQVTLAAATALAGSADPRALPALLDNFDRISRERHENAHDPRMAMLSRITEMGSKANAPRLTPYLADFDSTVATTVATTLSKWAGTTVTAHPVSLKIAVDPLAKTYLARSIHLRVSMVGGGTYTIKLFADEAPATVARIVKLARAHFYDHHVFQRVEPNFVVQGGGPDATEYVGDAQFMRDEVTWRSHLRGTLGISTRGRDTGDAQWFFNLTDDTRLDHEYTVFGEVVSGLNVVERIVAGGMIKSVAVVER